MTRIQRARKLRILRGFSRFVYIAAELHTLMKVTYKFALNAPKSKYLRAAKKAGNPALLTWDHGTNDECRRCFGMNRNELINLYSLTKDKISKNDKQSRAKLAATLSFLRSGTSFSVAALWWGTSRQNFGRIVSKVCGVICDVLKEKADCRPKSKDDWSKVAQDFYTRFGLPHCLGAIDGKHVKVTKHPNKGSLLRNYKGFNSIILLGVVDSDYRFIHFNVGAYGSRSDGGVWAEDRLGQAMYSGELDNIIPTPNYLPKDIKHTCGLVNYYFVGDAAFALHPNVMKPFTVREGRRDKDLYDYTNYRLSSGRMVVECAFGHLARRFGIFQALQTGQKQTILIVRAAVYLHNFIRLSRMNEEKETRRIMDPPKKNFGSMFLPPKPYCRSQRKEEADTNRYRLHLYFNLIDKRPRRSEEDQTVEQNLQ